jgi:hypothetical protein
MRCLSAERSWRQPQTALHAVLAQPPPALQAEPAEQEPADAHDSLALRSTQCLPEMLWQPAHILAQLVPPDGGQTVLLELVLAQLAWLQLLAVAREQALQPAAQGLVSPLQQQVLLTLPGWRAPPPAPQQAHLIQAKTDRPERAKESPRHRRMRSGTLIRPQVTLGSPWEALMGSQLAQHFLGLARAFLSRPAEFRRYIAPVPGLQPNLPQLSAIQRRSSAQALHLEHPLILESLFQN